MSHPKIKPYIALPWPFMIKSLFPLFSFTLNTNTNFVIFNPKGHGSLKNQIQVYFFRIYMKFLRVKNLRVDNHNRTNALATRREDLEGDIFLKAG